MGFSQNMGILLGLPVIRTIYSILGIYMGVPYCGKLPYRGLYTVPNIGLIKGDTWSLDFSSYDILSNLWSLLGYLL